MENLLDPLRLHEFLEDQLLIVTNVLPLTDDTDISQHFDIIAVWGLLPDVVDNVLDVLFFD